MQEILLKFVNNDLCEASLALLDKLGIKYTRGAEKPLEKTDLFTDKTLSKASTEALNFVAETYFVALIDERTFENNPNNVALSSAIDKAKDEKYNGMFVFAVDVQPKANITRTVAATITRAFNKLAVNKPVVLIIRQSDILSIATCERSNYAQTWREGEKIGKVSVLRDINCRNPHRGHIDLLSRILVKKATNFDELYKQWLDIFDVKLLSKKFYDDLFKWYEWVMQLVDNGIVKFPAYPKDGYGKESKDETIIRIITRMLFVWFIKEKGLIPENLFNAEFANDIIKNFNPKSLTSHNYYNAILQNLFFATLNCEKAERDFISENNANGTNSGYGVNSLYRGADLLKIDKKDFMKLYKTIPYLNGGLFERLDTKGKYYDGFSNEPTRRAIVPDALFFGDSDHCGLIKLFENYVFTVEENTPLEQSVSLDPELLGRVFENLLGAYNPETGTTARKSSGSYYTPREIVEYMVNESLVQHITKCGIDENVIRELLEYKEDDVSDLKEEDRSIIMNALFKARILDPACGSGAFPMGMLQQMVHILRRIDPNNTKWKNLLKKTAGQLANKAYQETDDKEERQRRLEEIENAFNSRYANPDYARKLFIIQNCIYGVDIQPIAMQISKLRFFISLICEQNNSNIMPLPNLETKFVCANTLIGINKGDGVLRSDELEAKKRELLEVRKQHFYARTASDKKKYRKRDGKIRAELEKIIADLDGFNTEDAKQLLAWNPYDQNASSPFFDAEWMFGINNGFDIVIANPPFVDAKRLKHIAPSLKTYQVFNGSADLYTYFYELGLNILVNNGILVFITSNKWIRSEYGRKLRRLFNTLNILQLIDFGRNRLFGATVDSNIIIVKKEVRSNSPVIYYFDERSIGTNLFDVLEKSRVGNIQLTEDAWLLKAGVNELLKNKIESVGTRLKDFDVHIYRGIVTGCNAAYHINTLEKNRLISLDVKNAEIIKPLICGGDITKYYCNPNDLWIINVHNGVKGIGLQPINVDNYPIVKKRLDGYYQILLKRCDKGQNPYNLRNCAYLKEFEREKIIWQAISKRVAFSYDPEGSYYCDVTTFFMTGSNLNYLLAIMNSKLFKYAILNIYLEGDTFKSKNEIIQNFPIPAKNNTLEDNFVDLVDQILAAKKKDPQADTTALERKIDILVYLLYGLTWDEVQIVENSL